MANVLPGTPTATGTLVVSDVDSSTAVNVQNNVATTYGFFSIDAGGNWTYNLDNTNTATQGIRVGQTRTENITVTTADGTTQTIVITVNGANDTPIANPSTGLITLVEDGVSLTSNNSFATGLLGNDTDVDIGDTKTITLIGAGLGVPSTPLSGTPLAGLYGSLTVNTFNATSGNYFYQMDNNSAAVQGIVQGQVVTDTFSYTMRDAAGATSTSTITFTINGVNDAPTLIAPLAKQFFTEDPGFVSIPVGSSFIDKDTGETATLTESLHPEATEGCR